MLDRDRRPRTPVYMKDKAGAPATESWLLDNKTTPDERRRALRQAAIHATNPDEVRLFADILTGDENKDDIRRVES